MRCGPALAIAAALVAAAACARGREYEVRGQVLAVDPARQEITIRHEDIRGFMPGMTMPFKVKDSALLLGRTPGELVTGTLVVERDAGWLKNITRTGMGDITVEPPPARSTEPVQPGQTVPDGQFVDQDGHHRALSAWRGQTVAVTFIYTRCPLPDFCPRLDRHFSAVQRSLRADAALRDRVHLLSVSFDPTFDTPAILSAHAGRAGADSRDWTFLTGREDDIDRFARSLGVSVLRGYRSGSEIVHNLRTAIVGADGRLVRVLSGTEWTPLELLDDLRSAGAAR